MNNWYKNYKLALALPKIKNAYPDRNAIESDESNMWYGGLDAVNDVMTTRESEEFAKMHGDLTMIGYGSEGVAYTSGSGYVVRKLTTDKDNIQLAIDIMKKQDLVSIGCSLPYVVRVYGVNKIGKKGLYEIAIQKVQTLNDIEQQEFNKIIMGIIEDCGQISLCNYEKFIEICNKINNTSNGLSNFQKSIWLLLSRLQSANVAMYDIHAKNVGFRDGDLVVLDVGAISYM